MLLRKKSKVFLTYLILISFTATSFAQEQVQRVEKGNPAPFDGWCLTDRAMGIIIADKEQSEARCGLRLQKQKDSLHAKYGLDIGNLQIQIKSLEEEYKKIVEIKDQEILKLEGIALKKPNNNWYLFAGGGFVAGVLTAVGVVLLVL